MTNVRFSGDNKPSVTIIQNTDPYGGATLYIPSCVNDITNYSSFTSGALSFGIWLTPAPYYGGTITGRKLLTSTLSNPSQIPAQTTVTYGYAGPVYGIPVPPDGVYSVYTTIEENGISIPDDAIYSGHFSEGNPGATIGISTNFSVLGEQDIFHRLNSGQMTVWEYNSYGETIDIVPMTYQGRAWLVDSAAAVLGAGQNFWGGGGHDVFLRSGAGQLLAQEFGSDGNAIDARGLTYQGLAWTVDAGVTALGTEQGFWGGGGHDVFLRSSSGQLWHRSSAAAAARSTHVA